MKLLFIGMGPGNGMSVARRFGREGFEILMVARDPEKLTEYAAELEKEGVASSSFAVDIADKLAFRELLTEIVAQHPDISIMHYNASAFNPALPSEIDLDTFMADLNINIVGALLSAQAVLPAMRARGAGTIFLTGGGTALDAPANLASLGVGKAGMRSLAFTLAKECKDYGIHVATITICGMIQPGTQLAPEIIAENFWKLHQDRDTEHWQTEIMMD